MSTEERCLEGGCACGAVRFQARGDPLRVGLCHCMDCRKAHASVFNPFIIYPSERVTIDGKLVPWVSPTGHGRQFCPACGSRVVTFDGVEAELSLGSFDDVDLFVPQYELWTPRRESWLAPQPVPQSTGDRDPSALLPPFERK